MPTSTTNSLIYALIPVDSPIWFQVATIRALAWMGIIFVVGTIVSRLLTKTRDATVGSVLVVLATNILRFLVAMCIAVVVVAILGTSAEQDTALGRITGWSIIVMGSVLAWGLTMFFVRQLLAPPWWRLNAWEPNTTNLSFNLLDAIYWIIKDIKALFEMLRPIDRLVAVVGTPLVLLGLMIMFGPSAALMLVFICLGICYVSLVVALFSANRIPRVLLSRLQDLRRVARRIANGELSARVGYTAEHEYEEISQLIADINFMARSLESREQENRQLNMQLKKELAEEEHRASTDQLTKLHNHRYFQEALAAEIYRCTRTGETTTIAIIDLDDFKAVNDNFGHQEGDAVLKRTAKAFGETLRPYDLPARLGGEEFGVIFPSTSPDEAKVVMDRLMEALKHAGPDGASQTFSGGIASFPTHATEQAVLYQLADSAAYAAKINGKKHTVVFDPGRVKDVDENNRVDTRERDAQLRTAKTLVQTVDAIEGFGNEHSENVGLISQKIAIQLGYDNTFAQQVYLTGLLHDVGKLGIDQKIVQKSGQLTPEEYEQVKRHPDLSAQIVRNAGLVEIATWVRHHHEHFDGSGYPMGLSGHDIPIGARIILVAEAFDVMTSTRSYRQALNISDAMRELLREAGTRFDPEVVQAIYTLVESGHVVASDYSATIPKDHKAEPISLPSFDDYAA